jgi:hypothetical protein
MAVPTGEIPVVTIDGILKLRGNPEIITAGFPEAEQGAKPIPVLVGETKCWITYKAENAI